MKQRSCLIMNRTPSVPRSILFVDDDAAVRTVLKAILDQAGHVVEIATNGREAVERISAGGIELIITDLVMPEQEGIETIKQISRQHPEVKVIAMSGAFGGDYLPIASFMGAHKTIAKPIRVQALLRAVDEVFDSCERPVEPPEQGDSA